MSFFQPKKVKLDPELVANTTPVKTVQEPVFKTPMSFSPRLQGERPRPSPSRFELWKEELGLSDGETSDKSDVESEDSGQGQDGQTVTPVEFQALQRQLEERDAQRDDLLYKIKNLTDKNKSYRQRLEKDEETKRQQLRIMRRTHEVHLQEKQLLIKNLEDIIAEQENDESKKGNPDLTRLVEQIENLQAENANLTNQLLTASSELENATSEHGNNLESIKEFNAKLEKENQELQEKIVQLQNSQSLSSTDAEKHAQHLESENTRLSNELRQLRKNSAEGLVATSESSKQIDKLRQENEDLRGKLLAAGAEFETLRRDHNVMEERLSGEMKLLMEENQTSARQARELSAKLAALQARSPEVVTKVKKVEIEDLETKELLEKTLEERTHLQQALEQLQQQSITEKAQISQLEGRLGNLEDVGQKNVEMMETLERVQKDSCEKTQELVSVKDYLEVLKQQVKHYENEMQLMENESKAELEQLRQRKENELNAIRRQAEQEMANLQHSFSNIRSILSTLVPELTAVKKEYRHLKQQCRALPQVLQETFQEKGAMMLKSIGEIDAHNQELIRKYRKEMKLRKKYHNELVDLKGNIRVFCRTRPTIQEDAFGGSLEVVVFCDRDDDGLINVHYKAREQSFDLDRVFDSMISQEEVFSEVRDIVTSCVDGYNVCIFAYGQTGSGKTYTMEGPVEDPGINQRALQQLFVETADRSTEWRYTITVSVLEIYNETIRDLLNKDPSAKLEVKMNPDGGLHVPGLKSVEVQSVDLVNEVFKYGRENRATASTNMNEHSSRSHALLCVNVAGYNTATGAKSLGKLNLVDLAGSERVSKSGADGTRLKEAQNINKSLSSLGDVIHALRSKQSHVPYRNSKLTYLLQDSLGGDSKTLMIVQVSPVEKNVGETLASLNFAQRVRSVELGQATKRLDNNENERVPLEEQLGHNNHILSQGKSAGKPTTPNKYLRRK